MDDLDEFFLDDINLRTPPHRPEHTTQNGDYQRPADFVHFNDAVPVNAASPLDPNYQQQPNQPQQQQETIADAGAVPHPHNHPNPTKGSIGLQNAEADLSREDPMAAETEAAVFHMIASEVNEVSEMIPDEPTSSSVSRNQFVSFESAAANERSSTQPMETYNTENRVVANNNKTVSLASPQSTDKHIGSLFSTSRMGEIANTVADIEMALFGELLIDKNKKKAASQQDIKTNEIIPNKTEVSAEDVHVDLPQQKELSGAKNSVFEKDPLLLNLSGDQIVETSKGGLDTSAEIKERNTTEPENEEVRFDSPPDIDTVESNNCNVLKRSHDRKKNSLTDEPSSSQCDNSKALIPYKPKLQFNSSEIMQTYSPDGKPTNQIILKIRAKIPHKKETDPKLFNGEPVTIHQSDSCEENGCNTTKHVKDTGFCETEKVEEVKNPINDDGADNHKNSRQVQQETADINKSKASVLYEEFDSGQEQPQTLDENLSKKEKMKSSKNYENGKVQTEPIEQSKPDNLEENTCEDDNTAGCVKSKLWGTETKQDELTGEKTEGETGMSLEEKKKKERDMEKWHHEISNHIRTWRREKLLETSSGYVDLFNKAEEQNGSVSDMRADDARPSNDENSIEKSNKLKMRTLENDKKTEVPSRRVSDVKVDVVKPRKEEKFMGNPNKVKMRTLENDKKSEVPSRRVSDVKVDVVKPRKEEKFMGNPNKVKMRTLENDKKSEVPSRRVSDVKVDVVKPRKEEKFIGNPNKVKMRTLENDKKSEVPSRRVSDLRADVVKPRKEEKFMGNPNTVKMRTLENDKKTEVPSRRVSDLRADVVKPRKEEKFMGNPNKLKMRKSENDKKSEVPSRRVSDVKVDVVKPRKEEKFMGNPNKVKMRTLENDKKTEVPSRRVSDVKVDVVKPRKEEKFIGNPNKVKMRTLENDKKTEVPSRRVSDVKADVVKPRKEEKFIEKSNKVKMRTLENDKKTEVPSRRVSDVKADVVKPRKEEKFIEKSNKVKMRTLENDKKTEVPSRRVSDVKADVVKPRKEEKFIEKSNKVKMRISENKKKKEVPLVKTHKPFRPKISLHEDSRSKAKWKKSSFFKEKKEFRKKKTNKPKRRIVYIEEDWEEEQNEKKRQEAEKAKKENENDDDVWTEEDERNLQAFLSLREPDEPGYGLVPMQNHSMSPCGVEDTKADGENDIAHKKRKLTTIDDSPFKALLSMDETELSDLLFVLPEIDGNSFQRLDVTRYDRLLHGYDSPAPTLSLEPLIIKALENTEEGKAMKGTIVEYVISNHNFPIPIRKVDKLLGKCLLEMVVHSVLFQLNSTGLRGFFFLDDPRSGFILPAGTYGYGPGR